MHPFAKKVQSSYMESQVAGSPESGRDSSGFFYHEQLEFITWHLTFKYLP